MRWDERIGRRLRLRDLHIFMAVVERGTMGRAASDLAMSQPAVSKAIADMEHTLGLRLLDRSRQRCRTDRLWARAHQARAGGVRRTAGGREGAAIPRRSERRRAADRQLGGNGGWGLPAIIREMYRRHPRIVINVAQVVFATMQYRDLHERSVDLLFGRVFGPPPEEGLVSRTCLTTMWLSLWANTIRWHARAAYPCGSCAGALDFAAAKQCSRTSCRRDVCLERLGAAACAGDNNLHPPCAEAAGERTVRRGLARLDFPIWRTRTNDEGVAGQIAGPAATSGGHHAEEPNAEPGGPSLSGVCPPNCWSTAAEPGPLGGSRTVLAVTPAERQLTFRFRTKSLQRGSRQFRAKSRPSLAWPQSVQSRMNRPSAARTSRKVASVVSRARAVPRLTTCST